jgi:SOS-response transcriptional repressor LexA
MYKEYDDTRKRKPRKTKAFARPFRDPMTLIGVYRKVEEFVKTNGYPPSIQDMVDVGVSPSTSVVRYYFLRMEQEGMMEITPRVARGIRLLPLVDASERVQVLLSNTQQSKS